ncbi:hypothetical protein B0T13DRAFT_426356 [Neurospora crassa]|nr:hypothetical protein B0T13DRAFT_426356 [Neurospora crassa]
MVRRGVFPTVVPLDGKDLDADREDGLSKNTVPVPTLNDDMPMLEKYRQRSKLEPIAMVTLNPSQPHACPPTLSPTPPFAKTAQRLLNHVHRNLWEQPETTFQFNLEWDGFGSWLTG